VKAEYTGYSSDIDGKPEYEPILHLKSVPVAENVEQSITPESEILKSLEGVRIDKLENVFTPQPTDDELWDEVETTFRTYESDWNYYLDGNSDNEPSDKPIKELKSKFKITRR